MRRPLDRDEFEYEIRSAIYKWRRMVTNGRGRELGSEGVRPFFASHPRYGVHVDLMKFMFRSLLEGARSLGSDTVSIVTYLTGVRCGEAMVRQGLVKSLDDVPYAFALLGIGLVDIVRESTNRFRVRIYECLSCYGSAYRGRTLCNFEAGALNAVFKYLYGKNRVVEERCWGLGDAYCQFSIVFC